MRQNVTAEHVAQAAHVVEQGRTRADRWGRRGSIGGLRGSSGMGAYQASKHAVIGLTRTAAHDNGPAGIRVNAIAPGPTETPMLQQTREAIPGGVEARIAATPLRKVATTTEVGNTAAWLLSDRASHISGVVLPVDGGFSS